MSAPASRTSYDPVELFTPCATRREKEHRQGILLLRDRASASLRAASAPHSIALLWMIVETATAWAYAGATAEELGLARLQCLRLAQCASFAEKEPVR